MERESMEFDVVIVGAGPAGLSSAIRLAQLAKKNNTEISICVIEKGAEVGAHILSGAVFETRTLNELIPKWKTLDSPVNCPVSEDQLHYLTTQHNHVKLPRALVPKPLHNSNDNHLISLGNLCRWLAQQATQLDIEIFPGFPAASVNYDKQGNVIGVNTSDMGRDKQGQKKANFEAGIELKAKYTIFAEGARGHLGKELIERFGLYTNKQAQHYALGLKELWQLPANSQEHKLGQVLHTAGYPLNESGSSGGGFLYHLPNNQIAVGLIVDLNYSNPSLSPFDEFQRFKHHPVISSALIGGERIAYGARAIAKGGLDSLPKQQFPGGLLIGCDAGTLNTGKIKGCHTAMKSGMLAAEAIFEQLSCANPLKEADYHKHFTNSWLYEELDQSRNFSAALHRFGAIYGGILNTVEHNILRPLLNRKPWSIADPHPDHATLITHDKAILINYPEPDGILSFDKPSSLYLSGTQHEEDQPCHLKLYDDSIPIKLHLPFYNEPSQRFCPAGVFEIVENEEGKSLLLNASNCLHCKTCDIKDPSQNINWQAPEGSGGPRYPNM